MVAPLVALGLRWAGGQALRMMFGTATRSAVTAVTADQVLNDGRVTAAAASTLTGGLTSTFTSALGLTDNKGETDWARLAGMGATALAGTALLKDMVGSPLALIVGLALAYFFRNEIGGLANSAVEMITGKKDIFAAAADPNSALLTAPTGPAEEITNPSPAYTKGLEELSRLSRGLGAPQPM